LDELLISRQIENRQSLSDGDFIEITGLTLQYPASKELLGPFSFSFKVTNEVVFYGESGIGKSSIFLFLQGRIKGFSGSFKINNCVVNQDELVGLFQGGMNITQKNYIFNASLVDNVTGFSRNVDSEHYSSSLELSCIEDTLIEKIGSLKLAENGSELSGGQRQRVLIARALYSDKYVYFFDEITSALDRQTALKILHNINEKKSKAIKFYISHDITLWDDPNVLKVKISKSV
jgi:ATP-binding cassette subfamily C protein